MKTQIVQIVNVNGNATIVKKDGGTYTGLKLDFTLNGSLKTKTIHSSQFSKQSALIENIQRLKPGDTIELVLDETTFANIVSVTKIEGSVPPTGTVREPVKKSFPQDNSVGMQVGNALTNAATLISHSSTYAKLTLEEVAVSILTLGESLKKRHTSGEFSTTTASTVKPKPIVKKAVVEEDSVFTLTSDEEDPFA